MAVVFMADPRLPNISASVPQLLSAIQDIKLVDRSFSLSLEQLGKRCCRANQM